jgi:hypothetical protein
MNEERSVKPSLEPTRAPDDTGSQPGPSDQAFPLLPGVHVIEPAIMDLACGGSWRLLAEVDDAPVRLIEVRPGPGKTPESTYRVARSPIGLRLLRGPLRVEAAFQSAAIPLDATVCIDAGVPYRLTGGTLETIFLVLVDHGWDGRI